MRTKRLTAMVLALVLSLSVLAGPALSASAAAAPQTAVTDQTNGVVSIRIKADGELVYGSPLQLRVETTPEDTQYIGVVVGTKGEAKGFVTLALSEKFRILLKMIPLPRVMSATPDQEEEFNVYDYLKQLIDGNDVSVLLRVADEVASVMDVLKFYAPTLNDISMGMKLSLNLIRRFLPEDMHTRIYLDEQPVDAGSYVAGAVALESGDMNTAGIAMFTIRPKSTGVRMYWNPEVPETLTAEQAQQLMSSSAVIEVDGQVVPEGKVSYIYRKKGSGFLAQLMGAESSAIPTEPGTYTQTAYIGGNYKCDPISRTITIAKPVPLEGL